MNAATSLLDGEGMYLLQFRDPNDLEDIRRFLRRHHVRVLAAAGVEANVSVPGSLTPTHERRELAGCVASWNALNPERPIELVGRAENEGRLMPDCLELAGIEANEAYYQRLATVANRFGFEAVMGQLESLANETLVEYVASRYVPTPAGRAWLDTNGSPVGQ
jgi:hypothetical protein